MDYDYDAYHAEVDIIKDGEVIHTLQFYTVFAANVFISRLAERKPKLETELRKL